MEVVKIGKSNQKLMNIAMFLQRFDEPVSIYDFVTAPEVASYWLDLNVDAQPYLGEELFPAERQVGMDIEWFKGQAGAPVALRPSALDVQAIPRDRKAFDKMSTEMAFYKESYYIDEKLRQELLKVMGSSNQDFINNILSRIFDDVADLLRAARLRLELNRMELLSTGLVTVEGNGQNPQWDYGFDEDHKFDAAIDWADADSDPIDDLETAIAKIETDTGVKPTRIVFNNSVMTQLRKNAMVLSNVTGGNNTNIKIGIEDVKNYLIGYLGIDSILVYTNRYTDIDGAVKPFIADDTVILLPPERLGTTWMGTTPEEADLLSNQTAAANVSIVDNGVAITTTTETDPVTVVTKVSMMSAPTYENMDKVGILKTVVTP